MTQNKVSIGPTSIVGWLSALLLLLPTIVKTIEEGQVAFNGPEKYLAIAGIVSGLITNIFRYLQAHKMIGNENSNTEFEEGITRLESAVKPDGPVVTQAGA